MVEPLLRSWVAAKVTELEGFEDEVVIDSVCRRLADVDLNREAFEKYLGILMDERAGAFSSQLWSYLDAQGGGVGCSPTASAAPARSQPLSPAEEAILEEEGDGAGDDEDEYSEYSDEADEGDEEELGEEEDGRCPEDAAAATEGATGGDGHEAEEEDDDDDDLEEDAAAAKKTKKKAFTVTLSRAGGSLGIAMNGNYVTAVHEGGAAATEGSIKVGDIVVEVNGKDTGLNTFAKLIPADKEKPIKMRLIRLEVVE